MGKLSGEIKKRAVGSNAWPISPDKSSLVLISTYDASRNYVLGKTKLDLFFLAAIRRKTKKTELPAFAEEDARRQLGQVVARPH